jgi:hypothetical protein
LRDSGFVLKLKFRRFFWRESFQGGLQYGRHGRFRTADLYRVKVLKPTNFAWGQSWLFIIRSKMKNIEESRLTIILRSHCAKIVPNESVNKWPVFRTKEHMQIRLSSLHFDIIESSAGWLSFLSLRSSRSALCSISNRNSAP